MAAWYLISKLKCIVVAVTSRIITWKRIIETDKENKRLRGYLFRKFGLNIPPSLKVSIKIKCEIHH